MSINQVVSGLDNTIKMGPGLLSFILFVSFVVMIIFVIILANELENQTARRILFFIQTIFFLGSTYSFVFYMYIQPKMVENWGEKTVTPYLKSLPDTVQNVDNIIIYKVGKKENSFYTEVTVTNPENKKKEIIRDWMTVEKKKKIENPVLYSKQLGPNLGYGYDSGFYFYHLVTDRYNFANDQSIDIPDENMHVYRPSVWFYVLYGFYLLFSVLFYIGFFLPNEESAPQRTTIQTGPIIREREPEIEPQRDDFEVSEERKKKREIRV